MQHSTQCALTIDTNNAKECLKNTQARFLKQDTCMAIRHGDLATFEKLVNEKQPDNDEQRGPYGETLLHIALVLGEQEIAMHLIQNFPISLHDKHDKTTKKFIDICYSGIYAGETALHLACRNHLTEVVKILVEENNPLVSKVTGTEFRSIDKAGRKKYPVLYCGDSPLHFAVASENQKDTLTIVKLLLEKWKNYEKAAQLKDTDYYGNNVLHVMAYHGIFNEIYTYFLKESESLKLNLERKKNCHGLTPVQLGISRGHFSMIEAIKQQHWKFGDFIQYAVPIEDICPIAFKKKAKTLEVEAENEEKKGATGDVSKPILSIIVDRWDHDMISHPIFKAIIRVKWELYVRRYFMQRFFMALLAVLSFNVYIAYDSGREIITTVSKMEQIVFIYVSLGFSTIGAVQLFKDKSKAYQEFKTSKEKWEKVCSTPNPETLLHAVFPNMDEDVIRCAFYCCVVLSTVACGLNINPNLEIISNATTNSIHAIGGLVGWIHILYFTQALFQVGPLILVIRKVFSSGFKNWLVIYTLVAFGFAIAFYCILKHAVYDTEAPNDWNTLHGSVLWTIRFLFAFTDFDNMRKTGSTTAVLLVLLHQLIVVVLLLNILVALLVDSFNAIAEDKESQWLLQMARITVNIDRNLSESTQALVLKLGFNYANLVEEEFDDGTTIYTPSPTSAKNVGQSCTGSSPNGQNGNKGICEWIGHIFSVLASLSAKQNIEGMQGMQTLGTQLTEIFRIY
ncbi:ankyrin repeat-containing domain protein [Obelidium mucronatum]|nr:ankyrin repeat-containing domain protein [Obelidium mucronatum]